MGRKIIKPSLDAHSRVVNNKLSFHETYIMAQQNPEFIFYTSGNNTPFTISSSITTRGKHKGEPVIIFRTDGVERARAYECCWGHVTNCGRTYIDCYTSTLKKP